MGKRIVVFGATGKQGGSVARYLAEDGFEVVGITRNPGGEGAERLKAQGVEIVQGDLDHPESYEEVLKSADGVFLNTDWWQWYTWSGTTDNAAECSANEERQAKTVADLCAKHGVKHIVYSTIERIRLHGRPIPHCEAKAEVSAHMESLGLPVTSLYTAYYMSNVLLCPTSPSPSDPETTIIHHPLPDHTVIPVCAVEQLGLFARVAFRDPKRWIGQKLNACTDHTTVVDIARTLSEVTGKKFDTVHHKGNEFLQSEWLSPEMKMNTEVFYEGFELPDPKASQIPVNGEAWDFRKWCETSPEVAARWGRR